MDFVVLSAEVARCFSPQIFIGLPAAIADAG